MGAKGEWPLCFPGFFPSHFTQALSDSPQHDYEHKKALVSSPSLLPRAQRALSFSSTIFRSFGLLYSS
jgi:hypothetical protein